MDIKVAEKIIFGVDYLMKNKDFKGKRELILLGLREIELYICKKEKKDKDDEFSRILRTRVGFRKEI